MRRVSERERRRLLTFISKFSLWDYLDSYITREDPIPDIRVANLYPSEASVKYRDQYGDEVTEGTCLRQAWLRIKLMENFVKTRQREFVIGDENRRFVIAAKPHSSYTQWVFRAGDRFEKMVKDEMINAGLLVCGHKRFFAPIRHGYHLSGELDMVGRDPFSGEIYGVENKSISGYNAKAEVIGNKGERFAGKKGTPKTNHLMQAAIYVHQWPELPYFKLVYIARDDLSRTEFDITVQDEEIYIDGKKETRFALTDVYQRFADLAYCLYNNQLPARDYNLIYSDQKMDSLIHKDALGKGDTEAWEKYSERMRQIKETGKGKELKRPVVGDWNCRDTYCPFHSFCYRLDGIPADDELAGL